MRTQYQYDCRWFTGYKPCPWQSECDGCEHYVSKRPQVLVVRVHQLGNVVKSSPIVYALRKRYDNPWIAWLTSPVAAPLVRANPVVDEVIEYTWEALPVLTQRRFELVVSLEANRAEAALAQMIPADERLGFGLHESGSLMPLNEQSLPYVALSLSDELRSRVNRKTLAELVFDLVGARYEGEEYVLEPSEDEVAYARGVLRSVGVDRDTETVVALATGGDSARFATKDWPTEHFAELARLVHAEMDARVVLVGGPAEREVNRQLKRELGGLVTDTGTGHSITQFAALLGQCDVVVCGDCFPMHASVAMKTPVVSVFGPTPEQEMAIFGRGRKIVSELECAPCYIRAKEACPHGWACMPGIKPRKVLEAVAEVLQERER